MTGTELQGLRQQLEKQRSKQRVLGCLGTWFGVGVALFSCIMLFVGRGKPTSPAENLSIALFFFSLLGAGPLFLGLGGLRRAGELGRQLANAPVLGAGGAETTEAIVEASRLDEEVRVLLAALPGARRSELEWVERELDQIRRVQQDLEQRLVVLRRLERDNRPEELAARRQELTVQLRTTSDAALAEVLNDQLRALEGQLEAEENAREWRARLEASRDTALTSLRHLRAELTVLTTATGPGRGASLGAGTRDLRELNQELAASREALEEVLQLRAG